MSRNERADKQADGVKNELKLSLIFFFFGHRSGFIRNNIQPAETKMTIKRIGIRAPSDLWGERHP